MPAKPKKNYTNQPEKDRRQTPPYAIKPLLPYLNKDMWIWESAVGEGYLKRALEEQGFLVSGTDILDGIDYFTYEDAYYDIQITNPPFSLKYKWLARAYEFGKPFALLMPSDTLFAKTAQELFKKHGFSMLLPNRRIDFKMPNKGWNGTAQMSTSWFCHGIEGMPEGITFVDLDKEKMENTKIEDSSDTVDPDSLLGRYKAFVESLA